jgi:hypothetical protein
MAIKRTRKKQFVELASVVAKLRQEAKEKGLDKMTMREINAAVTAVRREKNPLYGVVRRVGVTLPERTYRAAKSAAEADGWRSLSAFVDYAIREYLGKVSGQPAQRATKAISKSTNQFKTGQYEE